MLAFLLVMLVAVAANAQFYQSLNPYSYELNPGLVASNDNEESSNQVAEKRFVNSGQSIELICDLPNNMPDGKVLFIKYDNKASLSSSSGGTDIREDTDDERFEIGQQYAWEWSLKINAINEDDTGVYVCKVGSTVIKRFEIVVRVPPRIKDDPNAQIPRKAREGETVEFACFASGTPRPNITWFVISPVDHTLRPLPQSSGSNYLRIENVTRHTPRRYQCRASNNIPPSDTRNFTYSIEFAPEIEIQSSLDKDANSMSLNCTINAFPLTNRYFWRKDGNYINEDFKHEIRNVRLNDYVLISQLLIKDYDEADQGLYECSAENDMRVSKIVYNLRDNNELMQMNIRQPVDLMPIGYSNSSKLVVDQDEPPLANSTRHHFKNRKNGQTNRSRQFNLQNRKSKPPTSENTADSAVYNYESNRYNQRKHQRNHRNQTKSTSLIDKMLYITTTASSALLNDNNSPYVILINEDPGSNTVNSESDTDDEPKRLVDRNDVNNQPTEVYSNADRSFTCFGIVFKLVMVQLLTFAVLT